MTRISYSRWERLHYRLFGRWPQSVVDRRLTVLAEDEHRMRLDALLERVAQQKKAWLMAPNASERSSAGRWPAA